MNTELNWLLRVFALSLSFVIIWPFVCKVGMPMHSRLLALMNDQNCFGFVFRLAGCSFAGLSSELPKLFPVTVTSSLFCFFVVFVAFSLHSYYFTCNPGEVRFCFGVSARNIAVN